MGSSQSSSSSSGPIHFHNSKTGEDAYISRDLWDRMEQKRHNYHDGHIRNHNGEAFDSKDTNKNNSNRTTTQTVRSSFFVKQANKKLIIYLYEQRMNKATQSEILEDFKSKLDGAGKLKTCDIVIEIQGNIINIKKSATSGYICYFQVGQGNLVGNMGPQWPRLTKKIKEKILLIACCVAIKYSLNSDMKEMENETKYSKE